MAEALHQLMGCGGVLVFTLLGYFRCVCAHAQQLMLRGRCRVLTRRTHLQVPALVRVAGAHSILNGVSWLTIVPAGLVVPQTSSMRRKTSILI